MTRTAPTRTTHLPASWRSPDSGVRCGREAVAGDVVVTDRTGVRYADCPECVTVSN